MDEGLHGRPQDRRPFVRGEPNPVPEGSDGRTTIVWDTGDGSDGVVALVVREDGHDRLLGMTAGATGAYEVDWIGPDVRYRFRLFRRAAWDARAVSEPRAIAETVVSRRRRRDGEMVADLVFVGMFAGWIGAAMLAAVLLLRYVRSRRGGAS